jgi:hypoxia up-regulated 1
MHHDSAKLLPAGVSASVASFNITGVEALYKDDANKRLTDTQKPKVALSFQLDASGIVDLVKAEATLEEMIKVPLPKKVNKTETAAKAAAADKDKTADADATKTDASADATPSTDDAATDAKKADDTTGEAAKASDETVPAATATTDDATPAAAEEPQFAMRKKIHRFNLAVTRGSASGDATRACSRDDIKASRGKLAKLNKVDAIQREIAQAKNDVESHVYNTRQALEKDEWIEVSTESQREAILTALEAAESWYVTYHHKSPLVSCSVEPMNE